jgi:hypothetical protein
MHTPDLREAVAGALQRALADCIQRRATLSEAVAHATAAIVARLPDPSERPAERYRRENALAMEIMRDAHARGRGRSGATRAAKQLASDPSNMAERETLERRFRRAWRQQKSGRYPVAAPEPE